MDRLSLPAALLLCLMVPSTAVSGPSARVVEVNGVRLPYQEQGSGEPIVFIHGAFSDLRVWEPIREGISKRYRFIAFTQRYFGTDAWPDEGRNFSVATHADDLATFVTSLNAGPVHLIGRSYGGGVATNMALKNPALVRTLTVHEPALLSVLPADSGRERQRAKTGKSSSARLSWPPSRLGTTFRPSGCSSKGFINSDRAGSTACRKQRRQ